MEATPILSKSPLVTVVTVTYNSATYVRDAIESVLSQTYTNIEYIIGDDCSTDNTWSIINEYNDERIVAYRNSTNLGEYPNRNKAIAMANGKYLIFIDGDDIIYPHGVDFFVRQIEPFYLVSMAIQKNYSKNMLYPALLNPKQVIENYFSGDDLLSSSFASTFFNTKILQAEKLKTNYITGDEEIRLRLAVNYPIILVAGWVTWPRETPGQASSRLKLDDIVTEYINFSKDIFAKLNAERVNCDLIFEIEKLHKKIKARYILRRLATGNLLSVLRVAKKFNFSLTDLFFIFTKTPTFKDDLRKFTASNPYRNGFLNKRIER